MTFCNPIWNVDFINSTFGKYVDLDSYEIKGLVIILHREVHGWKASDGPFQFAHLNHQIYEKNLIKIISNSYEIIAVSLENGKKKTIWARSPSDITYP